MVRENRLKEYIFPKFNVTGSNFSMYDEVSNPHTINGEIVKIIFTGIASPGSLWIAESGTNIEYFRKNDMTSGLSNFEVYPFVYGTSNIGVTGSPQAFTNPETNGQVYLAGSGFTSGTGTTFGPVTLLYR
jgi:hypothetical protein